MSTWIWTNRLGLADDLSSVSFVMGYTASPQETDDDFFQADAQNAPCDSASGEADSTASFHLNRRQDSPSRVVGIETSDPESSDPESHTKAIKDVAELSEIASEDKASCSTSGSASGSCGEGPGSGAARGSTCSDGIQEAVDKGKGKQVVLEKSASGTEPEPQPEPAQPTAQQLSPTSSTDGVPWGKDPERPPQKLPIRFVDCVGRHFIWPWKKARDWKVSAYCLTAYIHLP